MTSVPAKPVPPTNITSIMRVTGWNCKGVMSVTSKIRNAYEADCSRIRDGPRCR